MNTIGRHLIAEFFECDRNVLDDLEAMRSAILAAAAAIDATVMGEAFHRYAPQGVSGIVLIAESHLSVHTWPEAGYAAVDIYTCGGLDPRIGFALLQRQLAAGQSRCHEILRGLPEELEEGRRLVPSDVRVLCGAPESLT